MFFMYERFFGEVGFTHTDGTFPLGVQVNYRFGVTVRFGFGFAKVVVGLRPKEVLQ